MAQVFEELKPVAPKAEVKKPVVESAATSVTSLLQQVQEAVLQVRESQSNESCALTLSL